MNVLYTIEYISDHVGDGIVAQEPIKPGNCIYTLSQDIHSVIIDTELLDQYVRAFYMLNTNEFFKFAFCYSDNYCADIALSNARFMNHSFCPNSAIDENGNSVCIRPIQVGEQITEDYTTYSNPHQYRALAKLYNGKTLHEQVNDF